MTQPRTLDPVRGVFRSVVRTVAPAAQLLDGAGWERVEAAVEEAILQRPPGVRSQVVLFLRLLGALAFLRHGRRLASLPPDRALRFLRAFERAPLPILRRGIWGVRTLAFLGLYGQPSVQVELGYRASTKGWEAIGADQGPWHDRGGAGAPEEGAMVARPPGESPHA